jgi:hypothetical protein
MIVDLETLHHESAHRAAAEVFGIRVVEVTFAHPIWDGGVVGHVKIEPGDHDPLELSIMAMAPAFTGMDSWEDPSFDSDRDTVEKLTPTARFLSPVFWTLHVRDKALEVVRSDEFQRRFVDAVVKLQELVRCS